MNPHADSVPSQAQIDEVVYACRQQGSDTTYDIVRAALVRFGTRPAAEPVHPNLGDTFEPTMNIYAQPGTVVRFRAGGGYDWEKKSAIEAGFVRNALYTVKRCDIDHSKTQVLFDEIPGRWNSCLFADVAAEPIQSGSAGETWRRRAEHLDRELKAARVDVDSEIIEGQLKDFLLRFGGKYDGNGMWGVSLYLEDICQIMSALSRQAPAAPAAKDFEQWWTSEVVANGGAPIGADYKHWAKAGFELRGDARAPAAPAEADFEREVEDWEASQPFYDLAWRHGASQHLSFDGDELESLTFSVKDFENFCVALTPAAPTQALLGWTRYEKARKLNPAQWAELHQRNLRGENFDGMIDALPATTQPVQQDALYDSAYIAGAKAGHNAAQSDDPGALDKLIASRDGYLKGLKPVQQDTRSPMQTWWFKELQEFWESSDSYITAAIKSAMDHIRTTPPAEKQAAPSGEDKA